MVIIYHNDVWSFSNELKNYYLIKETQINKLHKEVELEEVLAKCQYARWNVYIKENRPFFVIEEKKYMIDIQTVTTIKVQ